MKDIVDRLLELATYPAEGFSKSLITNRCLEAIDEIERLRNAHKAAMEAHNVKNSRITVLEAEIEAAQEAYRKKLIKAYEQELEIERLRGTAQDHCDFARRETERADRLQTQINAYLAELVPGGYTFAEWLDKKRMDT